MKVAWAHPLITLLFCYCISRFRLGLIAYSGELKINFPYLWCKRNLKGSCCCGLTVLGTQAVWSFCSTIQMLSFHSLGDLRIQNRLELQSVCLSSRKENRKLGQVTSHISVPFIRILLITFVLYYLHWLKPGHFAVESEAKKCSLLIRNIANPSISEVLLMGKERKTGCHAKFIMDA